MICPRCLRAINEDPKKPGQPDRHFCAPPEDLDIDALAENQPVAAEEERYVIIRYQHAQAMKATGEFVPGWEVLSSVLFNNRQSAQDFAAQLDFAKVYRLVEERS